MAGNSIAVRPFVEQFAALKAGLPGAGVPWIGDLREAAIERFGDLGLPTPRVEAWKYTRLRPLEKTAYRAAGEADASADPGPLPALLGSGACHRLVFVNGRLRPDLSAPGALPDGARIESLRDALASDPGALEGQLGRIGVLDGQPMLALNTAMMDDGYVLRIGSGVTLQAPVEIIFLGGTTDEPVACHTRNLILLDEGSRATVVEHHVGAGNGAYFANGATEISLAGAAHLTHHKIQAEGLSALHLATVHAEIGANATYDGFSFASGARLSRNEVGVRLAGSGAHCSLTGAYMIGGEQHCDNTTVIEHLVPDTSCREVFKGVLDGKARGVFQGRIVVAKDAQRTDGHQTCKTLLLSDRAEIDAKPELEIYADDVKCSHGATVGAIDEDALFYLRSRGIPEAAARAILVRSFLAETLHDVEPVPLAEALEEMIAAWISQAPNGEQHE
jgi:Fe-S cluster assembly protein SufD